MLIVPHVAASSWPPDAAASQPQTLLVDRQSLFLAAIAALLSASPFNATVRVATRTDMALDALRQAPAELVLCELQAVPVPGPDFAAALTQRSPPPKVVLLADDEDDEMLVAGLRSGATGFFTKECPSEEFLEGLRAVLAGHFVVDRRLVPGAMGGLIAQDWPRVSHPPSSLSASERGILAMVSNGRSIAGIAADRGISRKTVRNHLSNIYHKLGVRNRTEAILRAARMGLVSADLFSRD